MSFMQQGIKFTEGLSRMTGFLQALRFDITHTGKQAQDTQRPIHCYKHINNINLHYDNLLRA